MATIIKTIEQFKKHVTVAFNFDYEQIKPYIVKSERKYIKSIIGADQYEALTDATPNAESKTEEVFNLLEESSANLALFSYTLLGVIHISDAGFHISQNQNSTPAQWWQLRDLRRTLLETGNEAIDEALAIMEANPAEFTEWVESDNYTVFKELFVFQTSQFQRTYNIESSRITFLKLQPHLRKIEKKYFADWLGKVTQDIIKATKSDEAKEALEIAQAASVSLCVASVANEGAFLFNANGLSMFLSEIPGEKKTGLSVEELQNLHQIKTQEGIQYLKELKKHLEKYPAKFVEFNTKEEIKVESMAHNTKSIVSF